MSSSTVYTRTGWITRALFDTMREDMREAGGDAGRNAAAWWAQDAIGGRASGDARATAEATLRGMDEGDAAVECGLPYLDLSGQWADGPTAEGIYTETGDEGWPAWDELHDWQRDQLLDIYEAAFSEAMADEVARTCHAVIAPEAGA